MPSLARPRFFGLPAAEGAAGGDGGVASPASRPLPAAARSFSTTLCTASACALSGWWCPNA
eukprot:11171486-Alexandrium_andersonii.AAC.1